MFKIIGILAFIAPAALGCISGVEKNNMCSDKPKDNIYYLTSFCDKQVACGHFSGNCNEYFSASSQRFGCGSVLKCCQGTKCVQLKVIDAGPAGWVEDKAGKQIIDASYSTCKFFTGGTGCGWSDRIKVTCTQVSNSLTHMD